jgi:hypothetical protein
MENTLKFLGFKHSMALLFYLEHFVRKNIELELSSKCCLHILKTFQIQIQQSSDLLPLLKSVSKHMKAHYGGFREAVGMNLCALKMYQRDIRELRAAKSGGEEMFKQSKDLIF